MEAKCSDVSVMHGEEEEESRSREKVMAMEGILKRAVDALSV